MNDTNEPHGNVQMLVDDLERLLNRHRHENPLNWAEMIGALEIAKTGLLEEMLEVEDEEDDEDEDQDKKALWQ